MEAETKDRVAERWGTPPDDAVNYATIPAVEARALSWVRGEHRNGIPWVSPYPPTPAGGRGCFIEVLDRVHPPDRPIERLLSLCCGHGHAERVLSHVRSVRSCDGLDISPVALARATELAREAGLTNIRYKAQDIDQLKLEGTYDFVYGGGIHHIHNLEHVFEEVRSHLAPGAPFVMYEYVGASRCQYTHRQVEAINACIRLLPERLRVRVTAQRKLGVSSSVEAYELLRRRRLTWHNAKLDFDVFPLAELKRMGQGQVKTIESGVRVELSPEPWAYSAVAPKMLPIPDPPEGTETVLIVDAEVRGGQIGIGLVAADKSTYLDEFVVASGDRRTWHLPMSRPNECQWLVLRNTGSAGQRPHVDIHRMRVGFALPSADDVPSERPLATDPWLNKHFWNEFTPMTVAQWIATDESESVRAGDIIPKLRASFPWVEVHYTRGSLLQFVLYDIAGNFYRETEETRHYLEMLFHVEDVLMAHDDVPENFAYVVAADRNLTRK